MDVGLKVERLLMSLALLSLAGCVLQPAGITRPVASEARLPYLPYPLPGAPSSIPLPQPSNTAHKPASQTSEPAPEWTRAAQMKTPPDYASTIEKARQDLAARLGLDLATIQFIQLSPDEFPADTLGCLGPDVTPRPIPALVSGQVILLEARGVRYTYHARKEQVVFCGPWQ